MSMIQNQTIAQDTVKLNWGADAPEWITGLARACDAESQAAIARKIGRSASLVNQLLKNRYPGDLTDVKSRVQSALNDDGVNCPVMGKIEGSLCIKTQCKPFNPSNHVSVRLFRACRNCPNNIQKGGSHAE